MAEEEEEEESDGGAVIEPTLPKEAPAAAAAAAAEPTDRLRVNLEQWNQFLEQAYIHRRFGEESHEVHSAQFTSILFIYFFVDFFQIYFSKLSSLITLDWRARSHDVWNIFLTCSIL